MDAERFDAVKRLLIALEQLTPGERPAYLDRACAGDAALRAEVESLLHDEVPSIMKTGGLAARVAPILDDGVAAIGRRIGPYRLAEVLGEGGMGVVYRAEQTEPIHREVAPKLVRPGMDTARVIERFESERQALALMDHPGIARVFEAGSADDGRPYFVMELVRGEPITDYSARERLDLAVKSGGKIVAMMYLPASSGGLLDVVRHVADDTITQHQALNLPVGNAWALLSAGDGAMANQRLQDGLPVLPSGLLGGHHWSRRHRPQVVAGPVDVVGVQLPCSTSTTSALQLRPAIAWPVVPQAGAKMRPPHMLPAGRAVSLFGIPSPDAR